MKPLSTWLRLVPTLLLAIALLPAVAGARGLKDYQHIVWTQQHGLPSDLMDLAQTTDGWLWIGSGDGLFRFDGVSAERYLPAAHPGFAHQRVTELHAADNGDLYISYFPGGVAVLRRDGSFTPLPEPATTRRTPPLAMAVDRDGSLWAIGHGIRHFANGRWTTVESEAPWIDDTSYSLLLDQDGRLWASGPGGAYALDRVRGRFDKVSDRRGGLALAPNGDVWLLGADGAQSARLARSVSGKARPARSGAHISRLAGQFAADGTLWALGCPDTVCLVHDAASHGADLVPARDANERLSSGPGVDGREYLGILEDREGNIWVHANNGLNQFRPKRFLAPARGMDLSEMFYSMAADGDGHTWIAERMSGTLTRIGPDGVAVAVPGAPVRLLASGRDGALVKGDRRQIVRMRGDAVIETILLPPGPDGAPVDRQLLGLLDDGKRIWTAATDIGAVAWSDGKWQTSAQIGLPPQVYLSQAAGPGQLWLVLVDGTLVFFDDGKRTEIDARALGAATGIFPGPQLVLGGSEGLAVLRNGSLQFLRGAQADDLRGVSGIAVTANGDRWLNGVNGVLHVRAQDWQQALERPGQLLRYQLYGLSDGYPGRASIIWRSPSALSADGRHVWFLSTRGIVGLDSANLRRNGAAPRPVVMDVSTDSARFDAVAGLRLPPGSQDFRIRYTAPSLRQPERTRFAFRLEGFDADWRDAGNRRTTSYTNVGPGDYVFRVRAFNEDGVASIEDAALPITVAPTWVQSTPFRIALAAAMVLLLAMLYRLRIGYLTRQITARTEIRLAERTRIARTLHDSFLQTVYLLLMRLKKFTAKLPDDDAGRRELQKILEQARSVIDEGRDQVHELRGDESRTLDDIVLEYAEGLRLMHPDVEFTLRSEGAASHAHGIMVGEAAAIACEALRNAYVHAQARAIQVTIGYHPRALTVAVKDDGQGMAPEVIDTGRRDGHWGLVGMRERAAQLGGQLDIRSGAGGGTVITLSVPVTQSVAAPAL